MSSFGKGKTLSAIMVVVMACFIVGAQPTAEKQEHKDTSFSPHEMAISSCDDLPVSTDTRRPSISVTGDIICDQPKEDLHDAIRVVGDGAIESDGVVHYTETGIVVAKLMQQGQADDPWAEELDAFFLENEPSPVEDTPSSAESPQPKRVDPVLDSNHGYRKKK